MHKILFPIILFTSSTLYPQGSPGPIPQNGPYPLGGANSVMEQQVWLQSTTTLSQQVNAVTQDALQLHPVVLPPVTTSGDPNVYTSSGTPFVSPSPGPTSSSSTSSSSGFPGQDGDIVLWRTATTDNLNNIVGNGGAAYMDSVCENEANTLQLPNHTTAKAVIERSATDRCHTTFDGASPQSTAVYTVVRPAATNIYTQVSSFRFTDLFLDPPPNPPSQIKVALSGITGQIYTWSGCAEHSGDPSPHGAGNCQGWTSGLPSDYAYATNMDNGPRWERNGTMGYTQCGDSLNNFSWYCGLAWNGGSTSTTSSSSTSSGSAPAIGDNIVWSTNSANLTTIASGGGKTFMDGQCAADAAGNGWVGADTAVALANVEGSAIGCFRGLSGGSKNWTPSTPAGTFQVIRWGSFSQLFSPKPDQMPHYKDGSPLVPTNGFFTGCNSDGTGNPDNCNNFTTTGTSINHAFGGTLTSTWMNAGGPFMCHPATSRSWFCGIKYNGTSSSSSSSSSSTSSGFPGGPNDHVIWGSGATQWVAGIIAQGGPAWIDSRCRIDAQNQGWANWANAKGIINTDGNTSCASHFSGGTTVYMPVRSGPIVNWETVHIGTYESMFINGGPNQRHIDRQASGSVHLHEKITGCDNNGNPTTEHCNGWTDTTINYGFSYGPSSGIPSTSWMNTGTGTCAPQPPGPMSVGYFCGMKWGP